jgi:hypothetical protein
MERLVCGRLVLMRGFCEKCQDWFLVQEGGRFCPCCGMEISRPKKREGTRIIAELAGRKKRSREKMAQLIAEQENCCYYCGIVFGSWILRRPSQVGEATPWTHGRAGRGTREIQMIPTLDHFMPWSHCQAEGENCVAACQLCNGFKNNLMFQDDAEARTYLRAKWSKRLENGEIEIMWNGPQLLGLAPKEPPCAGC